MILRSGNYLNWLLRGSLLALIVGLRAADARHSAGHDQLFLTSVTRYQCYGGKQIYGIHQKTGYNYLISIDKDKLKIINNSGSSQQVCPALQLRRC